MCPLRLGRLIEFREIIFDTKRGRLFPKTSSSRPIGLPPGASLGHYGNFSFPAGRCVLGSYFRRLTISSSTPLDPALNKHFFGLF